jgi:hypothetical protein
VLLLLVSAAAAMAADIGWAFIVLNMHELMCSVFVASLLLLAEMMVQKVLSQVTSTIANSV